MEIQLDTDNSVSPEQVAARANVVLNRPCVIISAVPKGDLVNDYSPMWFIHNHPSSFPHGVGGKPKGMSLERWVKCTLNRYPIEQFAQNICFIADSFNVIQRHSVHTHCNIQFNASEEKQADINSLNNEQVCKVVDAYGQRLYGASLKHLMDTLPKGEFYLFITNTGNTNLNIFFLHSCIYTL